jgi:hypothetical protein
MLKYSNADEQLTGRAEMISGVHLNNTTKYFKELSQLGSKSASLRIQNEDY